MGPGRLLSHVPAAARLVGRRRGGSRVAGRQADVGAELRVVVSQFLRCARNVDGHTVLPLGTGWWTDYCLATIHAAPSAPVPPFPTKPPAAPPPGATPLPLPMIWTPPPVSVVPFKVSVGGF